MVGYTVATAFSGSWPEDIEFEASLGYIVKTLLQQQPLKKKKKVRRSRQYKSQNSNGYETLPVT